MKKILQLFLTLTVFFGDKICNAQDQNKTDSLFTVLSNAKEDTAKVNTLIALASELRNKNPDTSIYFANEALALATKLNYKMGIANAYLRIGIAIILLGKYEEA